MFSPRSLPKWDKLCDWLNLGIWTNHRAKKTLETETVYFPKDMQHLPHKIQILILERKRKTTETIFESKI